MPSSKYSAEAYHAMSPEQKKKRLDAMKRYYYKNKAKILARHNLRNANEKRFYCKVCSRYYKSNYLLSQHYYTKKHKRNVETTEHQSNNENSRAVNTAQETRTIEVS